MIANRKPELSEKEQHFKDKFPEEWLCPFCMSEQESLEMIVRDGILEHVTKEHPDENLIGLTWEAFYSRMVAVGGV